MKLLTQIANKYGTDKGTTSYPNHGFTEIYDDFFFDKRFEIKKILEIGIDKGYSLRMWRDYFINAKVYGIDVQRNQFFSEERIITSYANQASQEDIENFIKEFGSDFDLIVDDGGHDPILQQISLGMLFKHLKKGGVYIVEDLHTSFLNDWLEPLSINSEYEFTAYNVLKRFETTKKLKTEHINKVDSNYIEENISDIKIFDALLEKKHITCVITKK